MQDIPKTLFLGVGGAGANAVAYYRCFLPAASLGAEYATWGTQNDGRKLVITGGLGNPPPDIEDFESFEVIVIQYASAKAWLPHIRRLREAGVTLLYEIDDYLQGARRNKQHELADQFGKDRLQDLETAMSAMDGLIGTNDYIARRYKAHSPRTWACPNGIDLLRYGWNKPERKGVTLGFAGGVGHKASLARWEPAIRNVMRAREEVRFVSVGHPAAAVFVQEFGPERAISYPVAGIETYPASMTLFDISFAPSAGNNQFRGKSDLRWLECSALGVPLVAHPEVYPDIEDGVTGVHAETPEEAEAALLRLVDDQAERERIGRAAREYVAEHRSFPRAAEPWAAVLREAVNARAGV
ncbi:glycosyltransferase [Solirubrobacter sp. CPCC 204708]|uniref:Glycosyltransferase n=1 Tax=Solirubrobacter deserti TaxID=2282478 RepID=A0ABT4RN48_9ACTN|nr:glycosyltransferase [Solirubrobacter deserti]MBE2316900.1 glycosyltransferase [Solirubrobacter deserti]MDA0139731.1 glycosyltransferase [Solirubrobacter deserti]